MHGRKGNGGLAIADFRLQALLLKELLICQKQSK
jgi:hypothetical protein